MAVPTAIATMDDNVLPLDATVEELMKLAIENACNLFWPSTVPSGNLFKARAAKKNQFFAIHQCNRYCDVSSNDYST